MLSAVQKCTLPVPSKTGQSMHPAKTGSPFAASTILCFLARLEHTTTVTLDYSVTEHMFAFCLLASSSALRRSHDTSARAWFAATLSVGSEMRAGGLRTGEHFLGSPPGEWVGEAER